MKRSHLICALIPALFITTHAFAIETLIEEDHNFPLIYLSLAARTGASQDPSDKLGLTNFMGEMLKRGSKHRTKEEFDRELDSMGAQIEIETRSEAMIIRGAVLASEFERFSKLVTELVTEPAFPESEIAKLREELNSGILEEQGNDSALATRRFNQFMFGSHPYSHPVVGTLTGLKAITLADIKKQYESTFQASNLIVLATGDITPSKITSWTQALEKLRPSTGPATAAPEAPKDSESRRVLVVDKPNRTQTQIRAGWVGLRPTHSDYFAAFIGNFVLGGPTFNSRLVKEIRVKRGWTYGINSGYRPARQPNLWYTGLFPSSENAADALAETLRQIEKIKVEGITEEEFKFARDSLVNSDGFRYNTSAKRTENTLLEKTLDLPPGFLRTYADHFSAVTREQVNAALKAHFKPEKINVVVVGTAEKLRAGLAKATGLTAEKVTVKPYTEE